MKSKGPNAVTPCIRCGFCCKKGTCDIGATHGAIPTFSSRNFDNDVCKFLVGDKPGNYSCFLADKNVYPDIKMHLGIGTGCCCSLNSDRKKVVHGIDCLCDRCEKIRQLLRDGVESGEIYLVGLEIDKKKIMDK